MNESKPPWAARALAIFFFALTALTVLGLLAKDPRPPVASKHGLGVDRTITYILIVTGVIFVAGHAVLGSFVWRYSAKGAPGYKPVSPRTEWACVLAPVLLMALTAEGGVLALGTPVWKEITGEPPAGALTVEVYGKQFQWFFRYPGKDGKFGRARPELVDDDEQNSLGLDPSDPAAKDDIVSSVLHVPEGRPVVVRLRARDVVHSFSVPELRVKQDCIPGLGARTLFQATRCGEYEIACSELCGLGHYVMRGRLIVETPEAFERWLEAQRGKFER